MRIASTEDRLASGRAYRAVTEIVVERDATRGKFVQVGCVGNGAAHEAHRIATHLVAHDKNDVRRLTWGLAAEDFWCGCGPKQTAQNLSSCESLRLVVLVHCRLYS